MRLSAAWLASFAELHLVATLGQVRLRDISKTSIVTNLINLNKVPGKTDKARIKMLNDTLLKWVICDQQPFNLVDNKHFREFILELDHRYQLPTRQAISTQIIQLFTEKQIAVKEMLQKMKQKVSLTVDMWSLCTNQAYLAVTIHWINEDWRLCHILLDIIPFEETI